jgi:glutaminyl-peptide cyclotransferase
MKLGVPICHLIAVPFPSVWHTVRDDASALDIESVNDLALIFRVLVVEYLGLVEYMET